MYAQLHASLKAGIRVNLMYKNVHLMLLVSMADWALKANDLSCLNLLIKSRPSFPPGDDD